MSLWLTLPWLLPLLSASLLLLLPRAGLRPLVGGLTAVGLLFSCGLLWKEVQSSGVQTFFAGNWPAPFGITLVADRWASLFLLFVNAVASLGLLVFFQSRPLRPEVATPVLLCLWSAINGSILTGDLFNLYVWFEISLICSLVLMVLPGTREALDSTLRYLLFSLVASLCLLTSIGLLYGCYGSLNLADLSERAAQGPEPILSLLGCWFLVALACKTALFPWGVWLPECYTHLSPSYALFFGALLTKVSFFAWLRLLSLIFAPANADLLIVLQVAGLFTLLYGLLGALSRRDLPAILPYWICTSLGTVALAVSLWTPLALAAACAYLCHDVLVKGGLFCAAALVSKSPPEEGEGSPSASFLALAPGSAAMVLLLLFSMVGFPPFSGFWSKVMVLRACFQAQVGWLLVCLWLASVLVLLTAGRVWCLEVLRPVPGRVAPGSLGALALSLYALATLALGGVGAEWLLQQSMLCAQELMDPSPYLRAVLGAR